MRQLLTLAEPAFKSIEFLPQIHPMKFPSKRAVTTGAAGTGNAIALPFAREGADGAWALLRKE